METTLFVTKEYLEKQFKSFNNTLVKPNDKKIKEWLTTLNGDVDVEGSIANTIAKKIANVISNAPEEYDTLKEISDWISSHASNAEEMLAKIEANKEGILSENEKIELVEGIINTLNGSIDEEGSIAKMLKDAINTSVDNIIICESEDSKADWLNGGNVEPEPVVFTADMITDKNITSFVVPEGVTEIGTYAFSGCYKLESVTLPSTLTKIDERAFKNCYSLTSIEIPEGVIEIGNCAFQECSNLASVTLPSTLTKISDGAFEFCTKLESITLPSTLTKIGDNAFYNCTSLTSITIPEGVTEIERQAFFYCFKLESITLPSTLTKIGSVAFYGCSSLTSITIPEGVTEIEMQAFFYCSKLESITLPSTLTKIDDYAFYGCTSLATINYTGTEEQWNAITKDSNWNGKCPSDMQIVYNYSA